MSAPHERSTGPDYLAFHPPLVRLRETAPNPLGRLVLWTLLVFLTFLLAWAAVGQLDVVAVAEGRLVPSGYLKIVQPAEAGIVKEILVHEGDHVRAGDVLMRMDTLAAEADLEALESDYARMRLALARIDAELEGKPFEPGPGVPEDLMEEAAARYRANREALAAALDEERSRLRKAEQELAAARQQKKRLEVLLPLYREEETAFEKLADKGYSAQLRLLGKRRDRIEKEQELATQVHLIASAEAGIEQSKKKLGQIVAEYRRRLHAERQEVRAKLDALTQELAKQRHRRTLMELRAPQDGIVKELASHTAGTVVQPGTVLATLVPSRESLKAEVWISNEDIGFVRPGQAVRLKFAAYPFQKYGMGEGTVEYVSADAQTGEEVREARLPPMLAQPLRYKALVTLDEGALVREGRRYQLSAGMHVTAEILLGRRTVAEYLLSPVRRVWQEAGRER